jgi:hypothetical protein
LLVRVVPRSGELRDEEEGHDMRVRNPRSRSILVAIVTSGALLVVSTPAVASPYLPLRRDGKCLSETGTASPLYTTGCTSNDSQYWTFPTRYSGWGQIKNLHSHLCVTENTNFSLSAQTCTSNHVELWRSYLESTGGNEVFQNYHTGYCLGTNGTAITQVGCTTNPWWVPLD